MSDSIEQRMQIMNELGMHARAATKFVQTANKFQSAVAVEKDGQSVNGKSIMGVLMLVAAKGSWISVKCTGGDAAAAMQALSTLVKDKFGED
ncbi:MAG TPA: HPr family phosphocarrier protein [Polyangia bacterium]|jgi:phosphocarrier protein HPr|nr:HPr family phosphocarrier protein [Polyangia bacterium]HWE26941.1 HPr family phosphocarrier protein [Polyangia bacterium]